MPGSRNLLPRLAALDKLTRQGRFRVRDLERRAQAWRGILHVSPAGPAGDIATRALAGVEQKLDAARQHLHLLYRARAAARRASPTASRYLDTTPPPAEPAAEPEAPAEPEAREQA